MNGQGQKNDSIAIPKSFLTIGGIVVFLVGGIWTASTQLVLKSDIATLKDETLKPMQTQTAKLGERVRDLELFRARYFGGSGTAESTEAEDVRTTGFTQVVLQSGKQRQQKIFEQKQARSVVVPREFIRRYNLLPARGFGYRVLGADGREYALDDILAILLEQHIGQRRR